MVQRMPLKRVTPGATKIGKSARCASGRIGLADAVETNDASHEEKEGRDDEGRQ